MRDNVLSTITHVRTITLLPLIKNGKYNNDKYCRTVMNLLIYF